MVSCFSRIVASVFIIIASLHLTDSCSRTTRAIVSLSCPANIHVTADRLSTNALVQWNDGDFHIESTHTIRGLYQTYPDYGASGRVTKYFSEGRHQVEYKAVDESGRFDQCTFEVNVHVTRCPPLFNPAFGVLSCSRDNVYGSTCSYKCLPGFVIGGEETITCGSDGQWSHNIPICRISSCGDPGSVFWGSRYCSSATHAFGATCNYECDAGYKLMGNSTLICRLQDDTVDWSASTPSCLKIVPPTVEVCPRDMEFTSDKLITTVPKPNIVFRTHKKAVAPHLCSHFGKDSSCNFSFGIHLVYCRGFDPAFGELAVSSCQFKITIKPNPCLPLKSPSKINLMCSAREGASGNYLKSCSAFCLAGFHMPRGVKAQDTRYYCDHTGVWKPSTRIPNCVVGSRPEKLKLPSEMYYSSGDCRNSSAQMEDVREHFQGAVQQTLRAERRCAATLTDCLVDHVTVECRMKPEYMTKRSVPVKIRHSQNLRRDVPRLHLRDDDSKFQLSVKLDFGTPILQQTGKWPDEFQKAVNRVFSMFEYFEKKVQDGSFTITDRVDTIHIHEITYSLTHAYAKAICPFGQSFNTESKLCLPCGHGFFLSTLEDKCYPCPVGYYQDKQGQRKCIKCPLGTASDQLGSQDISECKEIDECNSNPCQNEGVCKDRHLGYTCICLPGYSGFNCEDKIYDCSNHACLNGGKCKPDGEFNYTCECRKGYLGRYCQNQTVDGGWSQWSDWSKCTKSCAQGRTTRARKCDSPVPANGGRPCDGPYTHSKNCNIHKCPECKRLRRPYGGNIVCKEENEYRICKIKCPKGYGFSSPVLEQYVCGPNTSHIWPHESPDNPRCILPSCTKTVAAEEAAFQFKANFPVKCESSLQAEIFENQINDMAVKYTKSVSCLSSGTCSLSKPDITGCPTIRKRRSTMPDDHIEVKVALLYHGGKPAVQKSDSTIQYGVEPMPDLEKTTAELANIGEELLNKSKTGEIYLMDGNEKVMVEENSTVADKELVCAPGSVSSFDGQYCVECRPGTYFSTQDKDCTLCGVGYYQPLSAKLECLKCAPGYVTFGRGAVLKMECYMNGSDIPQLPDKYPLYEEIEEPPEDNSKVLVPAILVPICVIVIGILILLIVFRKKFHAKYSVVKKQRDSMVAEEDKDKQAVELI